jgi:hypothetical protein
MEVDWRESELNFSDDSDWRLGVILKAIFKKDFNGSKIKDKGRKVSLWLDPEEAWDILIMIENIEFREYLIILINFIIIFNLLFFK